MADLGYNIIPHKTAFEWLKRVYFVAVKMGDGDFFAYVGLGPEASLADFLDHYHRTDNPELSDIDLNRLMTDVCNHKPTHEALGQQLRDEGFTTEKYLSGLIESQQAAAKAENNSAVKEYQSMIDEVLSGGKLRRN